MTQIKLRRHRLKPLDVFTVAIKDRVINDKTINFISYVLILCHYFYRVESIDLIEKFRINT